MTFSLTVEARTISGKKLSILREQGKIPAVVYGPKNTPAPIAIDKVALEKTLKEAGETAVITLNGIGAPVDVLVHDVAFDARRGGVIHVDFLAIEANKEVTVHIPLEFVGEAPAVKRGGTLTKVLHEVSVVCMPGNLPSHINVDVSVLDDFEKKIHTNDLVLPTGVRFESDTDEIVALVQAVEEDTADAVATPEVSPA